MRPSSFGPRVLSAALTGTALLAVLAAGPLVRAQAPVCSPPPYCPPGYPSAPALPPSYPGVPSRQEPPTAAPGTQPGTTPGTQPGTTPPTTTPSDQAQQAANEPSLSPERFGAVGGEQVALASPNMIGDQLVVNVGTSVATSTAAVRRSALVPFLGRGAFKIADNENVFPQNRVFFNYNFFSRVGDPVDINRETVGFEKAFLDDRWSFGMRLPLFQTTGDGSVSADGFGDLTMILKYAPYLDRKAGDAVCAGLAVTAPTGARSLFTFDDNVVIHDTVIQPYGGYCFNCGDFYVHGFSSLAVPTDSRDVTVWFNDIGTGYWLFRSTQDQLITAVSPTMEVHVTTPLNHRDPATNIISIPDIVVLTGGVNVVLNHRSDLTLGSAAPVTGPRPYAVEAVVQFNWRF